MALISNIILNGSLNNLWTNRIFVNTNYYNQSNLLGSVIYDIFTIMVTNAFLPNLIRIFLDFGHLIKIYKRRKLTQNPKAYDLNQQEANAYYI